MRDYVIWGCLIILMAIGGATAPTGYAMLTTITVDTDAQKDSADDSSTAFV